MADRSQPDRGCEQAPGDEKIPAVGLQRWPTTRVEDGLRSPTTSALGFRARPNRKDSLVPDRRSLLFTGRFCRVKTRLERVVTTVKYLLHPSPEFAQSTGR